MNFDGVFSQPSQFVNGEWVPATNFLLPRDCQMKLPYLEQMAEFCMHLKQHELPKIVPHYPCTCKPKLIKKRGVWGFKQKT